MKEITYWEKQLILYTKGHFGKVIYTDNILKLFAAKLYDLDIERVDPYNVNHMIMYLFETLVEKHYIKMPYLELFHRLFKQANKNQRKEINGEDIRIVMLNHMQGILSKGLDLGVADEDLKKDIAVLRQNEK